MCVGIDFCSKKNCLEQGRCLNPTRVSDKKIRINQCQIHRKFCSNERACEILGQCILDHPLVKANKYAAKELRKPGTIDHIVKVIEKLMPSLKASDYYRLKRKKQKSLK